MMSNPNSLIPAEQDNNGQDTAHHDSAEYTPIAFSEAAQEVDEIEEPVSSDCDPRQMSDSHQQQASRSFVPAKGWGDIATLLAQCNTQEEKDNVLNQLTDLADEIWSIVEAKRANNNEVPRGMLTQVGFKVGLTQDQVDRLVRKLEAHDEDRKKGKPVGPRVNAIIPGKRGRQPGKRNLPQNVCDQIIRRWRSEKLKTRNHTGESDPIKVRLARNYVFTWAKKEFSNHSISRTTIWRIIHDFETAEPARSAWSRGRKDEVRDNLQTVDIDFIGPGYFWIADIRPLPIRSRYKTIETTIGILQIIDAFSTKRLREKILPRQDKDEEGNIFGIDFTCKEVRVQLAMAMLQTGIRPRCIYVDNGAQFGPALEKFLDLLTPEGEEPTRIIHTPPGDPRGRGIVERSLALINRFIEFKVGFFYEDNYYTAIKKPKHYKYYDFAFLEKEFAHYLDIFNDRQDDGKYSPNERYSQSPNYGLSLPSMLQLGLFAGSVQKYSRQISRDGIILDKIKYVALDLAPEMSVRVVNAVMSKQKRPLLVVDLGEWRFLYVNLDDKGWVPYIKKHERRLSASRQNEWKRSVERYLDADHRTTEIQLQEAIIHDLFDPFHQEWLQEDESPDDHPPSDSTESESAYEQEDAPAQTPSVRPYVSTRHARVLGASNSNTPDQQRENTQGSRAAAVRKATNTAQSTTQQEHIDAPTIQDPASASAPAPKFKSRRREQIEQEGEDEEF